MKIGMRATLVGGSAGIAVLSVGTIMYLAIGSTQAFLTEDIRNDLELAAHMAGDRIDYFLEEQIDEVRILIRNDVFEGDDVQGMNHYLGEVLDADRHFEELFVVNSRGTIIASTRSEDIGRRLSQHRNAASETRALHRAAMRSREGEVFYRDAFASTNASGSEARTYLEWYAAFTDATNTTVLGVLVVVVRFDYVYDVLRELDEATVGDKAAYLVNSRGEVIFSLDDRAVLFETMPDIQRQPSLREALESERSGSIVYRDLQGDEVMAGFADLTEHGTYQGGDWSIISVAAVDDALRPAITLRDQTLGFGGIIIIFAIGMGLFMARVIVRDVGGEPAEIAAITETVASGNLDVTFEEEAESSTGILRSVRAMIVALKESRDAVEDRQWLSTGLARLNDDLRGEQDVGRLATKALSEIAQYLDAKVGALYVALEKDGTPTLTMLASYAYTKRKNLSNEFRFGEGLVGQAALEEEQILLRNVPEDYVRVTSGLGDHVPRFICVTPLRFEDLVKGVIEIGTLNEMPDLHLEYLKQATSALAVALETGQGRENLAEAFRESQTLTEELQAQQEELETANEELEEQTQALQSSEAKLQTQQEEMEVINEELLGKNEALERQKREVESAQADIAEKADELAVASKYKSEFLANMSHELRTPLNSLLLLARSLAEDREGNLSEEQLESARIIQGSGDELLALINEILDLAKIEAGRMDLDLANVALADLAESVDASFAHMAADKGLDFETRVEDDAPSKIVTDAKRLQQVVKNLVSNALKFTERGSVEVRFHRPSSDVNLSRSGLDRGKTIAISVIDTGIGIAADQQRVIFEAFQQVDGTAARRYSGTGLGLSISRELAKLLGGEIQLSSTPGKGSTFTLFLPLRLVPQGETDHGGSATPPTSTPARPPRPASERVRPEKIAVADDRDDLTDQDRKILIIEDDVAFARVLSMRCHERGFKCLVAGDGVEGLELAERYLPQAVILDLKLPTMDGWRVLDRLKQDTKLRHIPVHIISVEEPSTLAFRRGAVGHIHKPVGPDELQGVFDRIETTLSKDLKKLLVVEDDDASRLAIVNLVGGKDVQVDQASGAQEAIAALLENRYDCMILDLGLWDMDGEKLLETIRADEDAELPPVIVYTGRDLSRDKEMELREYTESIILKDVRSEDRLLDEVSLFLHRVIDDMPAEKRQVIIDLHDKDMMFEGKHVLVVDDDMRSAFALAKLLTTRGIKVTKAENGERALKIIEANPDVDLVLMDIMMPVMDGYETMRRIRAAERSARLPIIALTAKAMKGDREKCIAAGANDYLTKPVDPHRLLSMMRVWLYE